MAKIVFAAGASHAPAIVGWFDKAPEESGKVVTDTFAAEGAVEVSDQFAASLQGHARDIPKS